LSFVFGVVALRHLDFNHHRAINKKIGVIFSDKGTLIEDLDGNLQFGLAPALDELDLYRPLIDLFQKPVTNIL
jgi:hypothetical protein